MRFVTRSDVQAQLEGKRIAIVGSGPGVLQNEAGLIDGHDIVVRVNNYRIAPPATGFRCDVFYSFFGNSIKKSVAELKRDGVKLCLCKCPNAKAIDSEWHRRNGKELGTDFRWIYQRRRQWWFCDTYVPPLENFLDHFRLLGSRVPTTGFSAILDVLGCKPKSVYLTGFDFFRSKIHNLREPWRLENADDPIRHDPERELSWIEANAKNYPLSFDRALAQAIATSMRSRGLLFDYKRKRYPEYLKSGNACRFISPLALQYCVGRGLDIGAGKWPLSGAVPIDLKTGGDAMALPDGMQDYIFSSHCLEHLPDPVAALEHWKSRIRKGGLLFLYLPHPDMEYWLPQNNRKHLHQWQPQEMAKLLLDLGFIDVIHSERDLNWSFAVVGFVS